MKKIFTLKKIAIVIVLIIIVTTAIIIPRFSKGTTIAEKHNFESDDSINDGIYRGSSRGHNEEVEVEIEIEDGLITSVDVIEEDETIFIVLISNVYNKVPQRIIESQSTEVDVVSGATFASNAVLNAVEQALEEATND